MLQFVDIMTLLKCTDSGTATEVLVHPFNRIVSGTILLPRQPLISTSLISELLSLSKFCDQNKIQKHYQMIHVLNKHVVKR